MNRINTKKEHYLSIKLSNELFAVNVNKVLEVLEKQEITKVPNMPKLVKGVINFRGDILPVVEARHKFNMPTRDESEKHVIIVLDLKTADRNLMLGVVADSVQDVLEISEDQIKDVPDMGVSYNTEFLKGMVKQEKGLLILLNVDKVFSSEELNEVSKKQTV